MEGIYRQNLIMKPFVCVPKSPNVLNWKLETVFQTAFLTAFQPVFQKVVCNPNTVGALQKVRQEFLQ